MKLFHRILLSASFLILTSVFTLTIPQSVAAQAAPVEDCRTCLARTQDEVQCAAQCRGTTGSLVGNVTQNLAVPEAVHQVQMGVSAEQNNNANQANNIYDATRFVAGSIQTLLVGDSVVSPIKNDGGAVAVAGSSIVALYNPPATSEMYMADLMHDIGLNVAQPAYAQGLGFSALNPVLDAWKTFRNIAYFFYVVLFMIIGFMIMFRQKIGSQTVVSVQQALPNIIISLLAVTFSYAIAGLLIDAMYLIMFLIVALFGSQVSDQMSLDGQKLNLVTINIVQLGRLLISGDRVTTVSAAVNDLVKNTLGGGSYAIPTAVGWVAGIVGALIFAIALVFALFRLFFELLKTYVEIVVSIILSPIALMLGALPGSKAFSDWLRFMAYNLMVFPVVLVVIMLSFLVSKNVGSSSGGGGFIPPYLGGYGGGNAVGALIGMGMLLLLPDFVTEVKKNAPKGVFSQFAGHLANAVKKGWTGGELIPGVGFTDTRKLGVSGKGTAKLAAVGGLGIVPGAAVGLARGAGALINKGPQQAYETFVGDVRAGARVAADTTGSGLFKTDREKRKKVPFGLNKIQAYREKNLP